MKPERPKILANLKIKFKDKFDPPRSRRGIFDATLLYIDTNDYGVPVLHFNYDDPRDGNIDSAYLFSDLEYIKFLNK
jgi:hypothetical protein